MIAMATDRCIHGRTLTSRRDNPCREGHTSCTTRLGDTLSLLRATTAENGATTMNQHTCDQGPGHPILATNRGTCPACPPYNPTHDETDRGILDLAERIANDLARSGMDGDTDTVTLFLEQAIQVARATLSGSLDTVTQQIVLSRVEAATEAMADLLDDLAVGSDGPR